MLSAVTQSGGRDHILSPSYLGSVSNSSAPDKSSLHKLHKNVYQTRNHVQQLAVKKDTVVENAFIDFLVVNLDKNSG